MPVRLENLTSRPVWVALASGDSVRIAPGQKSASIADAEVAGSRKVQALEKSGAIAQHPQGGRSRRRPSRDPTPDA
jgi:hypothetical protein